MSNERGLLAPSRRAAERLYGALLHAYPRAFRRQFATGMRYAFVRLHLEARGRGAAALTRFWLRTAVHAFWYGLRERLGRHRPRTPGFSSLLAQPPEHRPGARYMASECFHEFRLAARRLAQAPAFATAAIVTLGLGIGATAAIFSVVHAVVISALPYPEADRLVWVWHSAPGAQIDEIGTSEGAYAYYREHNRTFDRMVTLRPAALTLTDVDTPERVSGAVVDDGFFELFLDRKPVLGRVLQAQDHQHEATRVAVISHRLWQQRYGADPEITSRSLLVEGAEYPVVGVLPVGFDYPSPDSDVWLPTQLDPARLRLGGFGTWVVGRLRAGVSAEDARADLQRLIPALNEPYAGPVYDMIVVEGRLTAQVTLLKDRIVGDVAQMLWILLGTVSFVLLTACANVANLFLVRSEARRREVAVRAALGARRSRILMHFLSESAVLTLGGAALALLLAYGSVRLLVRFGPTDLPRLHQVAVSPAAVALTGALTILAALLFGLLPGMQRRGHNLSESLGDGGRSATVGRERKHARNLLVASQVALALILLVGAGLMVRSFWHLLQVDPGFDAAGGLTFRLSVSGNQYPEGADAARVQTEVLDRLRALPGVTTAAATSCLPLSGCMSVNPLYEEGRAYEQGASPPAVDIHAVTDGYFEAMAIGLRAGRLPTRADLDSLTGAVVVSQGLADAFWPGEDPLGKRVWPDLPIGNPWYEIVGVVDEVLPDALTGVPMATIYVPLVAPSGRSPWPYSLSYVVKGATRQQEFAASIRGLVRQIDPGLAVAAVAPLDRLVTDAAAPAAFAMMMLLIAGVVALLLGAVGVYGVLAYTVSQRTNEIGVRMALGARMQDVRRMVLRQGAAVAAVGLAVGLLGAALLSRLLTAVLFEVSPSDPPTYAAVLLLLGGIALAASYLPARRASRVEPVEALRQ